MVGVYLGQLRYAQDCEQGMEVLNRSIEGFQRLGMLGMLDWVKHVQNLIDELKKSDGEG
jgi:hypothetical protein